MSYQQEEDFGPHKIDRKVIFAENEHSFAFTNIKCFRPGHVLVASKQKVQYAEELTPEAFLSLSTLACQVAKLMDMYYNCDRGYTITLQDGTAAGQTVPQVHYHIVPEIPAEDRTEEFKKCIELFPGVFALPSKWREQLEMQQEAEAYKSAPFYDTCFVG